MSVRKETGFHEGLESVADSEDKSAACDQCLDGCCNLLIVKHIGDELTASVRFVTGRESTAKHQYLTLVDVTFHLFDGVVHILLREVAEYTELHLGSGFAECLGRIVIAVRSREYRKECQRFSYLFTLVFEVCFLGFERLHTFSSLRIQTLHVRSAGRRINLFITVERAGNQCIHRNILAVYPDVAVHTRGHCSEELRIFETEVSLCLENDGTVVIVEQLVFRDIYIHTERVAE